MFDLDSIQKPETLEQALEMLAQDPQARLIAGGTDVLVRLRENKGEFRRLVDIHDLPELRGICLKQDNALFIGSGTTFTDLMESDLIRQKVPILAQAASTVAGPQIRNMATLGGNICNGAPSADGAAPLLALEARAVLQSAKGQSETPLTGFYLGPMKVDLAQDEILLGFRIKARDYKGWSGHYHKYAMRQAMDIATIGCAATCRVQGKTLAGLRLAYIVAGPTPRRCFKTEQACQGAALDQGLLDKISGLVLDDLAPRDSWRAAKDFREHIIKTLAQRVVAKALEESGASL